MGCLTHRRKQITGAADQKWDYINLRDFKSKGCFTPFAYIYLWFSLVLSCAVYGVDTFTAVQLLAFDRWPSQIAPAIGFKVSKWIFSICIIASFLNLAYEHFRAMRVMKRGYVAESYLDNLAVRLESIRLGRGQGWRRFLVFAELTKSKKGAEYIALFTYFSFQSWIRVIFCSGPRQAVNAMTLYSVYQAKLSDSNAKDLGSSIMGIFHNIQVLATTNYQVAVILSGMLFTLVIWVISALFLLIAVFFYVFFLFHWIPKADGGLSGYCERKINKALLKIVTKKVNKALAKEEADKRKADFKAAKKNGEKPPLERAATLPTLPDLETGDQLPSMPTLNRNDTMTTLPAYTSRPGTPGSFELSSMDQKRPMPARTGTMSSATSYSSRAPLVAGASAMGFASPASPAPTIPFVDAPNYPPSTRPGTSNSQRSFAQRPPMGRVGTHATQGSSSSLRGEYVESPSTYSSENMPPFPPPVRSPTARTMDSYRGVPPSRDISFANPRPSPNSRPTFDEYSEGRASPAPSVHSNTPSAYSNRLSPAPLRPTPSGNGPYQPMRSATNPVPPRGAQYPPQYPPQRNMTAPVPPRIPQGPGSDDYFNRPPTSQSQRAPNRGPGYSNYDMDVESQRDPRY